MHTDSQQQAFHYYQTGNFTLAETSCQQALEANPDNENVWCLLGMVYRQMGHFEKAITSYREAIRLRPEFLEAQCNLGNILNLQGKYQEAIHVYQAVLLHHPNSAETYNLLGVALRQLNRWQEAVDCYRCAVRLDPGYAPAHCHLGDALFHLDKLVEAEACCREALRLAPHEADAYNNLGSILQKQGRWTEALSVFEHALSLSPNNVDPRAQVSRASVLWNLRRYSEAEQIYRNVLNTQPDYADAVLGLGSTVFELNRPEEAVRHFDHAIRLSPQHADTFANRSQAHIALGIPQAALADQEQAAALAPNQPKHRLGVALAKLLLGDYERGWAEYECRWECAGFSQRPYQQPVWDGSSLEGQKILLYGEQGLGDTIQFARYAQIARDNGGEVILQCQKPLVELMATCSGVSQVLAESETASSFDVHAPLMSLPYILGTTLETIPASIPYLSGSHELVDSWKKELSQYPGLKVGIAWQGNPDHPSDRYRSVAVDRFRPLSEVIDVCLLSLQKFHGTDQLSKLSVPFSVVDLEIQSKLPFESFTDTAAVLKNLNLLITVDTALAHLAGALGVRVWVLLAKLNDARWLLNREDSPWYPTARLFRQVRMGDWTEVFGRVTAALQELVRSDPTTSEAE
ncbi:MAG: tetratricopeptide repeat protein [Gemmataceae bacterium]